MNRKAIFLLLAVPLLAWGYGGNARASNEDGTPTGVTVLASESVLLQQSSALTTSLAIPGAGELFITLTDLQFPTSFSSLTYAVSNTVGTLVAPTGAGTVTPPLQLTVPTTLYVNVFATVASGSAGLYNLTATFASAVPLPGTLGLFASGAVLVCLRGRRFARGRRAVPG
jgi:PEP-CTERM motif